MMLTEPLAVPCHKSVAGVAGSDVRFRDVPGRGQETLGRATRLPPASDQLFQTPVALPSLLTPVSSKRPGMLPPSWDRLCSIALSLGAEGRG